MINTSEILETITMIRQEHLDVRTITMGISLLDCIHHSAAKTADAVYDKIMRKAGKLVETGEAIEKEYGIPIINKRVSVTPISIVGQASGDYLALARALDRAAAGTGINFIGGYSALVQKGFTGGEERFLETIPEALAETKLVCSSVNVASTKAGINMTRWRGWAVLSRKRRHGRRTAAAWAVPSWWSLPTPWRTIPSWPGRSTVRASRNA